MLCGLHCLMCYKQPRYLFNKVQIFLGMPKHYLADLLPIIIIAIATCHRSGMLSDKY